MNDFARRINRLANTLRAVAIGVEWYAILNAIAAVIVGIALAVHRDTAVDPPTHPRVGLGVALMVGGVFWSVLLWCVGRALWIYAEDTAARHEDPLSAIGSGRRPAYASAGAGSRPPNSASKSGSGESVWDLPFG
jgi:hypothetical protein